ncbi:MAG: hypothetical protein QM617_13275 [Comamonas sp.]
MNKPTSSVAAGIADLYTLTLVDGLPAQAGQQTLRYKTVKLREISVRDHRAAVHLAERVAFVQGVPKLLVSDADYKDALVMRHIDAFVCDGQTIPGALVDLEMMGKLSLHDFGLLEDRAFFIDLAAEVRYGNLSQAEFDAMLAGQQPEGAAPQPVGQAEGAGASPDAAEPGPAMLADYAGSDAAGGTAVSGA